MLHDTLNPADWRKHYETYDSLYVEGMSGRFLIRRERLKDLPKCINAVSRAYQTSQRQRKIWDEKNWQPLLRNAKEMAIDGRVLFYAKPTHKFDSFEGKEWWLYEYSETKGIGWGWSFSWQKEPKEKLNHEFGQKWYELDQFSEKFSRREFILKMILIELLRRYIYEIYNHQWLEDNQFSNKIVKINLNGDEYWYKIGRTRSGHPVWENFIWQNNKTEEINL